MRIEILWICVVKTYIIDHEYFFDFARLREPILPEPILPESILPIYIPTSEEIAGQFDGDEGDAEGWARIGKPAPRGKH